MAASRVLIVDTPAVGLWSLTARLRAEGVDVVEVNTTDDALAAASGGVGVLLVHHAATIDVPAVLALARDGDQDLAVLAVVDGAGDAPLPAALATADVIRFPSDLNELTRRVTREVAHTRRRRQLRAVRRSAGASLGAEALIGESEPIARIRTVIRKMASSVGVPTLVSGPQGTGRALVARIVHDTSERQAQSCIRVDCTSRPSLPVELFGADDGTGSGTVEWADEGTVLLANVDRLTPDLQVALLRLIEDGLFRRIGSTVDRAANVRIIATTEVDLDAAVESGRFRRDLYYRVNVVRLDLPPLARRGRDVLLLAAHFAALEGSLRRQAMMHVDETAADLLLRYAWPGHVRELRQVIERAVMLASGDVLTSEDLAAIDPEARRPAGPFRLPDQGVDLDTLERQLVVEALERTGGNQTRAAELLGLHRDQIRYRMLKYGLRR